MNISSKGRSSLNLEKLPWHLLNHPLEGNFPRSLACTSYPDWLHLNLLLQRAAFVQKKPNFIRQAESCHSPRPVYVGENIYQYRCWNGPHLNQNANLKKKKVNRNHFSSSLQILSWWACLQSYNHVLERVRRHTFQNTRHLPCRKIHLQKLFYLVHYAVFILSPKTDRAVCLG